MKFQGRFARFRTIAAGWIGCWVLAPALAAQTREFSFDRISVAEGLSESAVTAILQDRAGFLWIGTHDGLNKYDGLSFKIFRHDPDDPRSVSENLISCLIEDREGNLWVGTMNKGLNLARRGEPGFVHFRRDVGDPGSIDSDEIISLAEDAEGTLWIGTAKGLNRWDRRTRTFAHPALAGGPAAGRERIEVNAIAPAPSGGLWVGTNAGLFRVSARGNLRRFVHDPEKPRSLSHDRVNRILVARSGEILVATAAGVDRLVNEAGDFSPIGAWRDSGGGEKLSPVTDVFEDERGRLWVGTYGSGLIILDERRSAARRPVHDANDPRSLASDRVMRIMSDRSGIVWIGTESGGLCKYSPRQSAFRLYRQVPYDIRTLSHNNITALAQDPAGDIWIGTGGGGLNRLSPDDGRIERFPAPPEDRPAASLPFVSTLVFGPDGSLWVGSHNGGVYRRLPGRNRLEKIRPGQRAIEPLVRASVNTLSMGRDGTLWVGTDELGLFARFLSSGRETWRRFLHDPAVPGSLGHNSVHAVLEDRRGALWVATSQGLDAWDRSSGTFRHFRPDPADATSLSHDWAWSLYEDRKGRLWVGTYGGGLNLFHPETGAFTRFTEKQGLANNVIYGILEDARGFLWLSTNGGLSQFDPARGTFRNYDAAAGLQSNEFNTNAFLRDRDGRLYFGGVNGLNSFRPEEIAAGSRIPPLAFTSLKIFDRESESPIVADGGSGIVLSHRQNHFSFEFAVLDFAAPQRNTYAYRLRGLDPDWVLSGKRRYAAYTNVPPGRYVFQVKGANNDGVWNERGISVPLTIVPPFWRRWWFRGALAAAALGALLAVIVFTWRYIRLLKANTKAESFAAVGRFASFFAHDLKSPLEGIHLIAGELRAMFPAHDARRGHMDDILTGVERLRSLVRSALDFSRAAKPRLEPTDLNALLRGTAEEFRGRHAFELVLGLDPDLPAVDCDPALMRRVLVNLLENSYQARRDALRIEIRSLAEVQAVEIVVSDNGRGIDPDLKPVLFEPFSSSKGQGRGFGLAFVGETVRNHGGRIRVDSEPGAGTAFRISLPRHKKRSP